MTEIEVPSEERDLYRRIERHLERQATTSTTRSTPIETVVLRVRRRRRRRRLAGATLAVSVVLAATAAALVLSDHPTTLVPVNPAPTIGPAPTLATTTPPRPTSTDLSTGAADDSNTSPPLEATLVPSDDPWTAHPLSEAAAGTIDLLGIGSGNRSATLAWSAAEVGRADHVSRVVRSSDGIEWADVSTSPGVSVLGGTEADGVLYLVGVAPRADPDEGRVLLLESDDAGTSWRRHDLGYDLGPSWDVLGIDVDLQPSDVAVRDGIVLITLQPVVRVDIVSIAGADAANDAFIVDDSGVMLLDPCDTITDTCLVGQLPERGARDLIRRLTWSELGFGPEQVALLDDEPKLLRIDGDRVEVVESFRRDRSADVTLRAVPDGFLAVVQQVGSPADGLLAPAASLLSSSDGRAWTLVGRPPIQHGEVARLNGEYVVVGPDQATGATRVVVSADGSVWRTVDLPSPGTGQWEVMPYGAALTDRVVALLFMRSPEAQLVRVVENGVVMEAENGFGDMVVFDEVTGEVLGGWTADGGYTGNVRLDDGPVITVTDDDGAVRAQFTLDDTMAAMNEQSSPQGQTVSILVSSTLDEWSEVSINSLIDGTNFWVETIRFGPAGLFVPVRVTDQNGVALSSLILATTPG